MSQAIKDRQQRQEQFDKVLSLIPDSLRTSEQLCGLLFCIGTTLTAIKNDTLMTENIALVDALADVITYRSSVEVESMIDAVKSITLTEETE